MPRTRKQDVQRVIRYGVQKAIDLGFVHVNIPQDEHADVDKRADIIPHIKRCPLCIFDLGAPGNFILEVSEEETGPFFLNDTKGNRSRLFRHIKEHHRDRFEIAINATRDCL